VASHENPQTFLSIYNMTITYIFE